MLEITVPKTEYFDETTMRFSVIPEKTVTLEHSLLTMSRWESKWEIPFLSQLKTQKTTEQVMDYIVIMSNGTLTKTDVSRLTESSIEEINTYLNARHSATWFSDDGSGARSSQTVTSELIYYWMTAFNIPFECENWPLARLMNLIKICSIKNNQDSKKNRRPTAQMMSERAALNAKRRQELNSKG